MSGRTAAGQQEYWKILLIFQVRKGRVTAATAKPAEEMRAVTNHMDLSPGNNSKTSPRDCRDQALTADSLNLVWLLFTTLGRSLPGKLQCSVGAALLTLPVLPLPRNKGAAQLQTRLETRAGNKRKSFGHDCTRGAGGKAGSHPVPSHTAWG